MKYLLLLLPLFSFAQQIPKGSERIEVQTALSDSLLQAKLVDFLSEEGWVRAREDTKRNEIVTDYKPLKYAWNIRLLTSAKSGTVTFRSQGAVQAMGVKVENEPLSYKGMGGAMYKTGFLYMNKTALKFKEQIPDATLLYK